MDYLQSFVVERKYYNLLQNLAILVGCVLLQPLVDSEEKMIIPNKSRVYRRERKVIGIVLLLDILAEITFCTLVAENGIQHHIADGKPLTIFIILLLEYLAEHLRTFDASSVSIKYCLGVDEFLLINETLVDFQNPCEGVIEVVVQFERQAVAPGGALTFLIPCLRINTAFHGDFNETAINGDAHIHRRIPILQQLLSLDKEKDAESRFSLLLVKYYCPLKFFEQLKN